VAWMIQHWLKYKIKYEFKIIIGVKLKLVDGTNINEIILILGVIMTCACDYPTHFTTLGYSEAAFNFFIFTAPKISFCNKSLTKLTL